jgi:hypothetical protein
MSRYLNDDSIIALMMLCAHAAQGHVNVIVADCWMKCGSVRDGSTPYVGMAQPLSTKLGGTKISLHAKISSKVLCYCSSTFVVVLLISNIGLRV